MSSSVFKIMTLTLLMAATIGITSQAFAAARTVELTIPDQLGYVSIKANFDGSITVNYPALTVNGEQHLLAPRPTSSAAYICKSLKRPSSRIDRTDLVFNVMQFGPGRTQTLMAPFASDAIVVTAEGKLDALSPDGENADAIVSLTCW